jgi:hypothetical protein
MINLSNTLTGMLSPLREAIGTIPINLLLAIKKAGKRGKRAHYPTDLRRVSLILETCHDVTGRILEVTVANGDVAGAMARLQNLWNEEDVFCDRNTVWNLATY